MYINFLETLESTCLPSLHSHISSDMSLHIKLAENDRFLMNSSYNSMKKASELELNALDVVIRG